MEAGITLYRVIPGESIKIFDLEYITTEGTSQFSAIEDSYESIFLKVAIQGSDNIYVRGIC